MLTAIRGAEKAYGKHYDYYAWLELTVLLMEMQIEKISGLV